MRSLTHSKARAFRSCHRLYYLRHELGLRPRIERPPRLRGSVFMRAVRAGAEAAEGEREAAIEAAVREGYAEERLLSQADADRTEFEGVVLCALAAAYLDRHGGTVGRREVEYELPLRNPATGRASRSFRLAGRIDGFVALGGKRALIVEDKLTSRIAQVDVDRIALDDQIAEYADALASHGWTADVEYRLTRWPSTAVRQKETLDQFAERFATDLAARGDWYFRAERVVFPEGALERFRAERWETAQAVLAAARRGGDAWYRNPAFCGEYGGCDFVPLCAGNVGAEDLFRRRGAEDEGEDEPAGERDET